MSFASALFAVSRSYFIILFSACQELFLKSFFKIFSNLLHNFSVLSRFGLPLSCSDFFYYTQLFEFVKNFFSSLFHFIFMFSTYSLSSLPPCDDLYYYTLSSPFVNTFFEKNFNFFEKLKKSPNFRAFSHFYHLYVMLFFFLFIISYICHSLFRYSETNF